MNSRQSRRPDLLDELMQTAAARAKEISSAPGAAARLRQVGSDDLSEIGRLETSPFAEDQLVAVALRLAGSRSMRGDLEESLRRYMETPASSLETEAQRQTIWRTNRQTPLPIAQAEAAAGTIERDIVSGGRDASQELARWAALYADFWCDPRIGASAHARRVMLFMVTFLHDRANPFDEPAPLLNGASL